MKFDNQLGAETKTKKRTKIKCSVQILYRLSPSKFDVHCPPRAQKADSVSVCVPFLCLCPSHTTLWRLGMD